MDRRPVEITAVWLKVINGIATVEILIDGKWRAVIREHCQDCFVSHIKELEASNGPPTGT